MDRQPMGYLAASRRADPCNARMLTSRCPLARGDWLGRAALSYLADSAISGTFGDDPPVNSFGYGNPGAPGAACISNVPGYADDDKYGGTGVASL